ncbi:nucleoside 2-deoxyribosyltransferase [Metabacillus sp. RGM 3146]|uniref:nucleoside 2-deoxyribosyltransferase n=1 Tax=Metabacillus sp. RGM 3146 TaxID=3401092 RepID=UPI003B9DA671
MKVFIASPFFDEEEKERLRYIENVLKNIKGLETFTAVDSQFRMLKFGSQPWRDAVFGNDLSHLHEADVVLAVHDSGNNKGPDSGTMWEIGYAYANRIPIVLFKEKKGAVNLMIAGSPRAVLQSRAELDAYDFTNLTSIPYKGEVI